MYILLSRMLFRIIQLLQCHCLNRFVNIYLYIKYIGINSKGQPPKNILSLLIHKMFVTDIFSPIQTYNFCFIIDIKNAKNTDRNNTKRCSKDGYYSDILSRYITFTI